MAVRGLGRIVIEFLETDPDIELDALRAKLERAFVARFGLDLGQEITAEVISWAWEHRSELSDVDNVAGYLFRVGQSKSRRLLRWNRERVRFPSGISASSGSHDFEPGLPAALSYLSDEQRTAVVLVHCFQWSYAEVADLMESPVHTVRNLVHRGLNHLRTELGVKI